MGGERAPITRRRLLGGAAAAGAASYLRPPTGLAAAILGRGRVVSRWLGRLSGESPPIRAPAQFSLVGLEWSGADEVAIELRAQAPSGRWSPWVSASGLGHDGDGQGRSATRFGEPVWTGPAIRVQVRSNLDVGAVRLHFVSAPTGPLTRGRTAGAFPQATPVLDTGPGQPPILARGGWAQGLAHPRRAPYYGTVKLAFVHHTVNPNGYGPAEVPGMLRAIFDYHVEVRGFWDIAYNFIIDAYGRIWEARAGGIDMAVVGAHAGAYNAESTGVAMLGDFMNVVPPPPAMHALEQLLAWKLSLHGLPALGKANVVVDPSDAFYTPFAPGAHVWLPRVAGHRDGDMTDCPGDALYGRLPAIRPRISALAGIPARLTVAPSAVLVTAGAQAQLSGLLELLSGQPLAGAPLELQLLHPGSPETTFATTTTEYDGSWSADVGFLHNTLVRALHRPYPASVSDWVQLSVEPALTLNMQSSSPLILTGTVSPAKPRVTVDLYRAGGNLHEPVFIRRTGGQAGTFTALLKVPGPGDYVAVARTPADASNAAGASPPLAVTIS